MRNRISFLLATLLMGAVLSGCATAKLDRVKPWQRGALADPIMNPAGDGLRVAMQEHVYFSRETASGGRGVGGAGCGCN